MKRVFIVFLGEVLNFGNYSGQVLHQGTRTARIGADKEGFCFDGRADIELSIFIFSEKSAINRPIRVIRVQNMLEPE